MSGTTKNVQRNLKKLLTLCPPPEIVASHTVTKTIKHMRTKSFLAAAALVAAGVLSSQAQSNVYSLNVVGYVNLTVRPGFNLLTAQLKTASATAEINTVLTNITGLDDGSTFFGWNSTLQTFTEPANYVGTPPDGPAWYNADYTALAADTAPRGTAFFINKIGPGNATITLVGEVPQGANSITVPNNYGFLGDFVPTSQEISTNGFPIADGNTVSTWDPIAQGYTEPLNGVGTPPDGPAWYNADYTAVVPFAPAVGQGFLHSSINGSAPWTRNFTVQ